MRLFRGVVDTLASVTIFMDIPIFLLSCVMTALPPPPPLDGGRER